MQLFAFAAGLAALALVAVAAAETPTVTPATSPSNTSTPGGSPTAATPTASPASSASPSPAATAAPTQPPPPIDGGEPAFNYDIVKEVVVPLVGDDGRTHYVTLSQDTNGIVRIRLSLFDFPRGSYTTLIRVRAACDDSGGVAGQLRQFTLDGDPSAHLVLTFWNTDLISLTPGARNSIYDSDGAALVVYRPGDAGPTTRAACAILAAPPGAPALGTGIRNGPSSGFLWPLAGAVALAFLATGMVALAAQRGR